MQSGRPACFEKRIAGIKEKTVKGRMKKLLPCLGVVALLAGGCCSGGGRGGSADEYQYHNRTVEYNTGNSYTPYYNKAMQGTGSSTARNTGFMQGD
jgi:hypothetical protein